MKDWRDTNGLADLLEARASFVHRLRRHVTGLRGALCGATGHNDEDVALNKLLDEEIVRIIVCGTRVVATDDGNRTLDTTADDGVVERTERAAELTTEHVLDILVAKAGDHRFFVLRDKGLAFTVCKIVDCRLYDLLSGLFSIVLVELIS